MSESKKQILEELIRFLKDERELYGDWNPGFNPKKVDTMNKRDYPQTGSANESLSSKDKISKQDTGQPQRDSQKESAKKNSAGSSAHDSLRLFQSGSPAKLDEQLKACANLNQLRELCEQSQDLRTDLEGTNLVFGVGDPEADLMLIGEAPGYYEDQQGEPFVGKAGQLLNKILEAIRFKREDVYISNILKHRPPKNRDPKPEERQKSLPYLMRQIDLIRPKLILCLGRVSATTLLNREDSLKNMRGRFHPFRGAELMVTYHPAALLRHTKWKRPTWEDVQLLRERYDELGGKP